MIAAILWMLAFMTFLWILHLLLKNAAIVDVGWSLGLLGIILIYVFQSETIWVRKFLVTLMGILAYGRLGLYLLFNRVIGHSEEGRYLTLRKKWGKNVAFRFLIFFQYQTILAMLFSIPFLVILSNQSNQISVLEILGSIIWLVAFVGEALSDEQLKKFKSNPKNKGKVCEQGLWHYSRHPNYFFQWLMWVAYLVSALSAPQAWMAFIGPILMGYFLLYVTGIPATEAQAVRSKGDLYRNYQRTTSAFIPWFKKV